MENFFDQFDEVETLDQGSAVQANPFDAFDNEEPNPFDQFDTPEVSSENPLKKNTFGRKHEEWNSLAAFDGLDPVKDNDKMIDLVKNLSLDSQNQDMQLYLGTVSDDLRRLRLAQRLEGKGNKNYLEHALKRKDRPLPPMERMTLALELNPKPISPELEKRQAEYEADYSGVGGTLRRVGLDLKKGYLATRQSGAFKDIVSQQDRISNVDSTIQNKFQKENIDDIRWGGVEQFYKSLPLDPKDGDANEFKTALDNLQANNKDHEVDQHIKRLKLLNHQYDAAKRKGDQEKAKTIYEKILKPPRALQFKLEKPTQEQIDSARFEEIKDAKNKKSDATDRFRSFEEKLGDIPQSPVIQEANKHDKFSDQLPFIKRDKGGYLSSVIGGSAYPMVETIAEGIAASVATGGNPYAFAAGLGHGSMRLTEASQIMDYLQEESGEDLSTVEGLERALNNDETLTKAKERAKNHGIAVGAFDAVSGGIATKFLVPKNITGELARKLFNTTAQTTVQAGLGAGGEAAGQLASGTEFKDLKTGEIVAEALAEGVMATPEVAAATVSGARKKIKQNRLKNQDQQPVSDDQGQQEQSPDDNPIERVNGRVIAEQADNAESEAELENAPEQEGPPVSQRPVYDSDDLDAVLDNFDSVPDEVIEKQSIIDTTSREEVKKPEGRKNNGGVDTVSDSILTAIAKLGGLSREESESQGIDPAAFKDTSHGIKRAFTKKGRSFDAMAETLQQLGYPVIDEDGSYTANKLLEAISDELGGVKQFTSEGNEYQAQLNEVERKRQHNQSQVESAKLRQIPESNQNLQREGTDTPVLPEKGDSAATIDQLITRAKEIDLDAAESALESTDDKTLAQKLWAIVGENDAKLSAVPEENYAGDNRRANTQKRTIINSANEATREMMLYQDPLTGKQNRRAFDERTKEAPAVAAVDVDSLAWVNDNMTHAAGDKLLVSVSDAISKQKGVEIYRLGGDEFAVTGASQEALESAMQAAAKELSTSPIVNGEEEVTPQITWGKGKTYEEADIEAGKMKSDRVRRGIVAARKEKPATWSHREQIGLLFSKTKGDNRTQDLFASSSAPNEGLRVKISTKPDGPKKALNYNEFKVWAEKTIKASIYYPVGKKMDTSNRGYLAVQASTMLRQVGFTVMKSTRSLSENEIKQVFNKLSNASSIDAQANEAATSPKNDLPQPTDAQKEAGNYKVGKVKVHGLDISIENPKGSTRSGVSRTGKKWSNKIKHHYGDIKKTKGADGDALDVFLGPDTQSENNNIFVIGQKDPDTNRFDEHKVMMGFKDKAAAKSGYLANYDKGWKGLDTIDELTPSEFKAWLKDGDTTKPVIKSYGVIKKQREADIQAKIVPFDKNNSKDQNLLRQLKNMRVRGIHPSGRPYLQNELVKLDKDIVALEEKVKKPESVEFSEKKADNYSTQSPVDYNVRENGSVQNKKQGVLNNALQRDLFATGDLSSEAAKEQLKDNFDTVYKLAETRQINVGVDVVNTPEEAAHVFAPFRKQAQENFLLLTLDKNNKPISVIHQGKGVKNAASVSPTETAGAIAATNGAVSYYLGHNHPAGISTPSGSDFKITRAIIESLDGSDIEFNGHIVLGNNDSADYFSENGADYEISDSIKTKPLRRNKKIPITERVIQKKSVKEALYVNTLAEAFEVINKIKAENAVAFLDNRHRYIGHIAMSPNEMKSLRKGGRVKRLLKAFNDSNSERLILKSNDVDAAKNFYTFALNAKAKILDYFYPNAGGGHSSNQDTLKHTMPVGSPLFFSKSKKSADPFYSALNDTVQKAQGMPKKGKPGMFNAWINGQVKKGNIKQSEVDWMGLDEWIDEKGELTREELQAFVSTNQVKVEEVVTEARTESERKTAIHEAIQVYTDRHGYYFDDRGPDGYSYIYENPYPNENEIMTEGHIVDLAEDLGLDDDYFYGDLQDENTKYGEWQTKGDKKNYRELLITLPRRLEGDGKIVWAKSKSGKWVIYKDGKKISRGHPNEDQLHQAIFSVKNEKKLKIKFDDVTKLSDEYKTGHFEDKNIVVHTRFNERTDADGKRVLFVEEIQSDWAQEGKKKGFKKKGYAVTLDHGFTAIETFKTEEKALNRMIELETETGNKHSVKNLDEGVPNTPFKNTAQWSTLALKRIIRHAAENGFDRIAWTPGAVQADRYDLSKQVDAIRYEKKPDGTYNIYADNDGNVGVITEYNKTENELSELVGKDLAKKIIAGEGRDYENGEKIFIGVDLKVGGEGMKGFYDKILPATVNKYVKKFGAKTTKTKINDDLEAWSIDVTDKMRDTALQGQPLFSKGKSGKGVDYKVAKLRINSIIKKWKNKPNIRIVQSVSGLPERYLNSISKEESPQIEGFFDTDTNTVYLIADNLKSMADVERVLFHEALGHYGIRQVLGTEFRKYLNLMIRSYDKKALLAKIKEYDLDPKNQEDLYIAAEEILANIAEVVNSGTASQKAKNLMTKILNWIRRWLRDNGYVNFKLGDTELRAMMIEAARAVKGGQSQPVFDSEPALAFSKRTDDENTQAKEKGLDMSTKARMKRAIDQGFVYDINALYEEKKRAQDQIKQGGPVSRSGNRGVSQSDSQSRNATGNSRRSNATPTRPQNTYHGSRDDISAFKLAHPGRMDSGWLGEGIYVSDNPIIADTYAKNKKGKTGQNVMPLFVRLENPYISTEEEKMNMAFAPPDVTRAFTQKLKQQGYDGVILAFNKLPLGSSRTDVKEIVVFDPKNIRSAHAAFDPDYKDSPNLLYSKSGTANNDLNWSLDDESKFEKTARVTQNLFNRIKTIQSNIKDAGGTISDEIDVDTIERLHMGKAADAIQAFTVKYVKPIEDALIKDNISPEDLDAFLYALHAPERNRHIASINPKFTDKNNPGSGMSNAEAKAIVAEFKNSDKLPALKRIAKMVHTMTKANLDRMIDAGLEPEKGVESWRDMYKFYVPLKGHKDNVKRMFSGKGYNMTGKNLIRALGRRSQADSPFANAINDSVQMIVKAEKAKVGQALFKLATKYPNDDVWEVVTPPEMTRRVYDKRRGEVIIQQDTFFQRADNVLTMRIDGEQKYLLVHDEKLADAYKKVGVQLAPKFLNTLRTLMRYKAGINTSYNPDFVLTNPIRDIGSGVMMLLKETDKGGLFEDKGSLKTITTVLGKSYRKSLAGIYKVLRAEAKGGSFEIEFDANGKPLPEHEYAHAFQQFRKNGGMTGFYDMNGVEGYQNDIRRAIKKAQGNKKDAVISAILNQFRWLQDINTVAENAVRLSAYKFSVDQGLSEQKSASLGRQLTVDFNRKGEIANMMGVLYLFYNAAIQGSAQFAKAASSKKVKYALAAMVAQGIMQGILGRLLSGEDEDSGEDEYERIPDYIKERNVVIPNFMNGGKTHVNIPLPYGYNAFHYLGVKIADVMNGENSVKAAVDVMAASVDAFSPLQATQSDNAATSISKFLAPEFLDPFISHSANQKFTGGPIYKENYPNQYDPESHLSFSSTARPFKGLAEFLFDKSYGKVDVSPDTFEYIWQEATGGSGASVTRLIDTISATISETEEVELNNIPVLRRFYAENPEWLLQSSYYDKVEEVLNKMAYYEFTGDKDSDYEKYKKAKVSLDKAQRLLRSKNRQRNKVRENEKLDVLIKDKKLDELELTNRHIQGEFIKKYNLLMRSKAKE